MWPQKLSGKLLQLSRLPFSCWCPFILGWFQRRRMGYVPCVYPKSRRLILVPLAHYYESHWFFCESRDGLRELSFFLDKLRPNDVVFDIGAFQGAYGAAVKSVYDGAIPVFLFEPLEENARKITEVGKLNQFHSFTVIRKAVGSGTAIIGSVGGRDCMLRPATQGIEGTEFPSTSIDAFSADSKTLPSIMKIDVEGYEFDLLEGAPETLRSLRPRLWIEIHPIFLSQRGRRWADLIELIQNAGYRITFFDDFNWPSKEMAFHIWCEP
jgi:FkbM family methyltransferase